MKRLGLSWFSAVLLSMLSLSAAKADIYNYEFTNGTTSLSFQLDSTTLTDLGGYAFLDATSSSDVAHVGLYTAGDPFAGGFDLFLSNLNLKQDSTGPLSYQGPALYDAGTLTLFTGTYNFVGYYNTTQSATLVVTDISTAVPEPSTWAMMILGFFFVASFGYRRRDKATNAA